MLSGVDYREMEKRLAPIASLLGIEKLLNKYPYEVSGGQKQRAAVARAIITNPELILLMSQQEHWIQRQQIVCLGCSTG